MTLLVRSISLLTIMVPLVLSQRDSVQLWRFVTFILRVVAFLITAVLILVARMLVRWGLVGTKGFWWVYFVRFSYQISFWTCLYAALLQVLHQLIQYRPQLPILLLQFFPNTVLNLHLLLHTRQDIPQHHFKHSIWRKTHQVIRPISRQTLAFLRVLYPLTLQTVHTTILRHFLCRLCDKTYAWTQVRPQIRWVLLVMLDDLLVFIHHIFHWWSCFTLLLYLVLPWWNQLSFMWRLLVAVLRREKLSWSHWLLFAYGFWTWFMPCSHLRLMVTAQLLFYRNPQLLAHLLHLLPVLLKFLHILHQLNLLLLEQFTYPLKINHKPLNIIRQQSTHRLLANFTLPFTPIIHILFWNCFNQAHFSYRRFIVFTLLISFLYRFLWFGNRYFSAWTWQKTLW